MYGIFYLHLVDFDGFHVGKINLPYMNAMGFTISSFQTRGVNFVSLKITRFFRVFRRFEREMWVAKNGSLVYWSKKEAVDFGKGNFWEVATQIFFMFTLLWGRFPF